MNPITTLATLFLFMTLLSASILYYSFKGRADLSGRYFLTAEILMVLMLVQVISTNLIPELRHPAVFLLGTALINIADMSVFFSICALNYKVKFRTFVVVALAVLLYGLFVEYARSSIDPRLPASLVAIPSGIFALITYIACKHYTQNDLRDNIFNKWIAYAEAVILLLALIRIASYFYGSPVIPRDTPTSALLIYTVFAAASIFRYISYQSLRISWINPKGFADSSNALNQNLYQSTLENKKLLEILISSNRKIGISALASSIAHQFSQPITALSFQIHTARLDLEKEKISGNTLQILDKANIELEKLVDLVSGLRRFFENQEAKFEKINLTKICDSALNVIEPSLKSRNIELIREYCDAPEITGNEVQIQQIIINIMNNAVDAIAQSNKIPRKIKIQISQKDVMAEILITDSGIGIDKNLLPNIFDLYKTTKKNGLGVGLWLSKIIVERHHGSIKASNNINGGATFQIQIPNSSSSEVNV